MLLISVLPPALTPGRNTLLVVIACATPRAQGCVVEGHGASRGAWCAKIVISAWRPRWSRQFSGWWARTAQRKQGRLTSTRSAVMCYAGAGVDYGDGRAYTPISSAVPGSAPAPFGGAPRCLHQFFPSHPQRQGDLTRSPLPFRADAVADAPTRVCTLRSASEAPAQAVIAQVRPDCDHPPPRAGRHTAGC